MHLQMELTIAETYNLDWMEPLSQIQYIVTFTVGTAHGPTNNIGCSTNLLTLMALPVKNRDIMAEAVAIFSFPMETNIQILGNNC